MRRAIEDEAYRRRHHHIPLIVDTHTATSFTQTIAFLAETPHVRPLRRWPHLASLLLRACVESLPHSPHPNHPCKLIRALERLDALPSCRVAPSTQAVALRALFKAMLDRALDVTDHEAFVLALCRLVSHFDMRVSRPELAEACRVVHRARLADKPLSADANARLLALVPHTGYIPSSMGIQYVIAELALADLPWDDRLQRAIRALGMFERRGVVFRADHDKYPQSVAQGIRWLFKSAQRHVDSMDAASLQLVVWSMANLQPAMRGWPLLQEVLGRCVVVTWVVRYSES